MRPRGERPDSQTERYKQGTRETGRQTETETGEGE